MRIQFGEFYIEPGVWFHFSWRIASRLAELIDPLVSPSATFIEKYGRDYDLIFRISAKTSLQGNEIRGPTVFRNEKDVEFTVFLPFDVVSRGADVHRAALEFLLDGVSEVFATLGIDSSQLARKRKTLIDEICSDGTMFEQDDEDDIGAEE